MIGKFHSFRQHLGQQDPVVLLSLINTYIMSLYGSNIWDLSSAQSERVDKAWNSIVRTVFGVPINTHRFIVENLTEGKHIRVKLLKRFQNFYKQLESSRKREVLQLIRLTKSDNRSVFGRNCRYLLERTGAQNVCEADFNIKIYPVPEGCDWKLSVINELMDFKRGLINIDLVTQEEAGQIIDNLCSY